MTCTVPSNDIADLVLAHYRQCEGKYRSSPRIGPRGNGAAMRLDDRPRNRQTNAHPLAFRGDEWLEQLLAYLGRNSRSSIGDVDLDHPAVRRRRYDEFAVLGLLHRFDGVAHEVEQNRSEE